MIQRVNEDRRIVEILRIVLAIIAVMLILEVKPSAMPSLLFGVLAFSVYAVFLLWKTTQGSLEAQHHFLFWIDVCWILLLLFLADDAGTHYFLLLLFPLLFAAWRTGYRESMAVAAFSGLGSLIVFTLNDPQIPWWKLLVMPFSLFVISQIFVALARIEEKTHEKLALAQQIAGSTDPRHGFNALVSDFIPQIARKLNSSVALLALRTPDGRVRVTCWEDDDEIFELSEKAATPLVEQALSLPADLAVGWLDDKPGWWRDRQIEADPSGLSSVALQANPDTLLSLSRLAGKGRLLSVPISAHGVGKMRLFLAGESIEISMPLLNKLQHMVKQFGSSVENAYLREELASEAADTERARIGRDLHDSAIQPYIGLKFAVEAVQRRAGPDNIAAPDLARLASMVGEELSTMREVISGLRGDPGKGGALLSSAVRRHAARCGQFFGIDVEVDIEQDVPVSRRLAGELFHMVAEGLSNIARHTQSRWAKISLCMQENNLILRVQNKNDEGTTAASRFTPSSLTERAADLGGSVNIGRDELQTTIKLCIPIANCEAHDGRHMEYELRH